LGTLARGGGSMTLYEEPPERLPSELQNAVRVAVALTSRLAPPAGYDGSYWREERVAIANLAVWQAYLRHQPERGIPLERFATLCAVRAIVKEWKRLKQQGQALVTMPVDEETGSFAEEVDGQCGVRDKLASC
jgi:hypothetical protein